MKAAVFFLGLALTACSPREAERVVPSGQGMDDQGRNAFSFDVPEPIGVVARPGAIDFKVYELSIDGVPVVGVYAGDFADFPPMGGAGEHIEGQPERFTPHDSNSTQYLWRTGYDWPSQLHVWTMAGLNPSQEARARALATSIHPTRLPRRGAR